MRAFSEQKLSPRLIGLPSCMDGPRGASSKHLVKTVIRQSEYRSLDSCAIRLLVDLPLSLASDVVVIYAITGAVLKLLTQSYRENQLDPT